MPDCEAISPQRCPFVDWNVLSPEQVRGPDPVRRRSWRETPVFYMPKYGDAELLRSLRARPCCWRFTRAAPTKRCSRTPIASIRVVPT